jgi:SAM-dependent methyltransferase
VNPNAVAFCRRNGLSVEVMRPGQLPFGDSSFEGAVLDNVLEHLEQPEPLLTEVHRILRIGGRLVIGVPGSRGFDSDPDHKRHYPEDALILAAQNAGFTLARIFHQPFYSRLLDRHFRYYAIYGLFFRS